MLIALDGTIPSSIKVREVKEFFVVDMKGSSSKKIKIDRSCSKSNEDFKTEIKTADSYSIVFNDKETAEKVAKALTHAAKLNGAKEELF